MRHTTHGCWGTAPEYRAVVDATFRLFAALAIVSYLSKLELARGYVLVAFPVGLVALLVTRRLWRSWLGVHRARGRFADSVLVVGDLAHVQPLVRDLRASSDAGFRVVAICCAAAPESVEGIPVVGCEEDAAELAQRVGADVVAYAASSRLGATGLHGLGLEGTGIDLVVAPGMTDVAGPRIHAARRRPVLLYVEAPRFTGPACCSSRPLTCSLRSSSWSRSRRCSSSSAPSSGSRTMGGVLHPASGRHGGRSFVMTKFRSMTVGADQVLPEATTPTGRCSNCVTTPE